MRCCRGDCCTFLLWFLRRFESGGGVVRVFEDGQSCLLLLFFFFGFVLCRFRASVVFVGNLGIDLLLACFLCGKSC